MPTQAIQASFNSGEWSSKLYARVDITKYRSGAALLQNYFVDYRGGASTRSGTRYINQCYNSTTPGRLIPFQASFNIGYVLEFGDGYIRFFYQGSPVLEPATSITIATAGPPEVFTDTTHGYSNSNWILVQGNYYIVQNVTPNTFTLTDLFGNAINANPFTLPANAQRPYGIISPYAGSELKLIKFAQNVNTLILCHPNHPPYQLVLNTATNWTLSAITFGSSITAPISITINSTLGGGPVFYGYTVTSVDSNGQESGPATPQSVGGFTNMATSAGSNQISWPAVAGAVSYNVYKATVSYFGVQPPGVQYGLIGNVTGTRLIDTNIGPDFSLTPPVPQNPFFGSGVASVKVTAPGSYASVPPISFSGGGGSGATAAATLLCTGVTAVIQGGDNWTVGDTLTIIGDTSGAVFQVSSVSAGVRAITGMIILIPGNLTFGAAPTTAFLTGAGGFGTIEITTTWGLNTILISNPGTNYATPPAVGTAGSGTATAVLGAAGAGNPTVPGFFQQRLVLAGEVNNPQGFDMSRPGIYYNFDVSTIAQPDDAISGTIVSGQLNTIKSMVPQPSGLLMFTDRSSWLINGGSNGSAVTPSAIVANAQSFNGVSDVPPIVASFDVLYVQAKGSIIRDSAYNIYANVYTGTDISIIASHLFYGHTINEWAWAEEPFKVVWAVRDDGVMLTLTFLKEQEFTGWAHSTTNGLFKSVATVIENTSTAGEVDAIYTVVQRTVNGQTLQYIERVVERTFPNGLQDAWCVDCGIEYTGSATLSFSGAQFLGGQTCTGLQTDDKGNTTVIPAFVMPANGAFNLAAPPGPATGYVKVIVGIGYNCDLQTLPLELGDPTVQGKVKKINSVDVLVADTLGLNIGSSFNNLTPMQDLILGNVSSMLTGQDNQLITGLTNGQARTILDPTYTVPGQYCIRQSDPIPATILGVVPNVTVGDLERIDR